MRDTNNSSNNTSRLIHFRLNKFDLLLFIFHLKKKLNMASSVNRYFSLSLYFQFSEWYNPREL